MSKGKAKYYKPNLMTIASNSQGNFIRRDFICAVCLPNYINWIIILHFTKSLADWRHTFTMTSTFERICNSPLQCSFEHIHGT